MFVSAVPELFECTGNKIIKLECEVANRRVLWKQMETERQKGMKSSMEGLDLMKISPHFC